MKDIALTFYSYAYSVYKLSLQDFSQVRPSVHFMSTAANRGQFMIIQIKAPGLLFSLMEVKSGNDFYKSAELRPTNMCKSVPTR